MSNEFSSLPKTKAVLEIKIDYFLSSKGRKKRNGNASASKAAAAAAAALLMCRVNTLVTQLVLVLSYRQLWLILRGTKVYVDVLV